MLAAYARSPASNLGDRRRVYGGGVSASESSSVAVCSDSVSSCKDCSPGSSGSSPQRRQRSGQSHSHRKETQQTLWHWIKNSDYDGAVWTDGERNFENLTGKRFSLQAAQDHLWSLRGVSLEEARRYIREAPSRVETPLRKALDGSPWWHHDP